MSSVKQESLRQHLEARCVCETCLSSGRRLFRLADLRHIYMSIMSDRPPMSMDVEELAAVNVCWECVAALRRTHQFKQRAARAQEWLDWAHAQQDSEIFLPDNATYSSLEIAIKSKYDLEIDADATSPADAEDDKPLVEILAPRTDCVMRDVWKTECESDNEFSYEDHLLPAHIEDYEDEFVGKAEPVDPEAIFTELPIVENVAKRTRKTKLKSKGVKKLKAKREIKRESKEVKEERKKRPKANPFDAYTVTKVSNEEVLRHRDLERRNMWYIKSPHKCESCIYGFRSEAQFNKHLLSNHSLDAGNFACTVCQSRKTTKKLLEKHLKTHHERYVCNVCGLSFSRIHTMRQHHTAKHKMRKCKYCPEEFYDLKSLSAHRKEKHLNFQCDKCGKKTTSRHTLKKHLRSHEPYPCGACDMVFTKKKNLDQHVRNRHETRSSEAYCVECDRQFASRPSYLLHVTEKHSPAVSSDMRSRRLEEQVRRLRRRHDAPESAFCVECDRQFASRRVYLAHVIERHDRVRFRCPVCAKPFNRKVYMKNHYNLMHLKKTNYYCKICDKYICRKDGLRKHIEFVHEGKRLPKNKMCDICGRGFSTNKTLTHHRRTHTGERPYQCEFCTASFAQSTALKTHVKHIHLQVKRVLPMLTSCLPNV